MVIGASKIAGAFAVASLAVVACGSSNGGASDPPVSLTYSATYKTGVVALKSADVQQGFQSLSSDGTTFTFAASTPGLSGVKAGTVLVIPQVALVRVTSATTTAGSIVLATEPAALTDALEEGSVAWEQEFATTDSSAGSAPFARPMAAGLKLQNGIDVKPDGGSYSGTLDGYDYKLTLTTAADKMTLDLTVTYKDPNFEVSVQGSGTLSGFRSSGDIEVHQGSLQKASVTARNLSGSLTLSWAAGKPAPTKSNAEQSFTFKIPFKLTRTLPIDGIPIIYSIGADISITPLFAGGDSSSQGSVTVPFGGTVTMDPSGGWASVSAPPTISTSSSTIALAPSGFVAGVSFPSLGVGLGFSEANVMLGTKVITVATTQTPGGVSGDLCEQFDTTVTWTGNATATLFGLSGQTNPKTLYTKDGTLTIPAGANCGG